MNYVMVLHVPCGEETHRIAIDKRLRAFPLDNNLKTIKAFVAFDAPEPPCLSAYDQMVDSWLFPYRPFGSVNVSAELYYGLGSWPHDSITRAVQRAAATAHNKKTHKERFGRFLMAADIPLEEKMRLAKRYAGPHAKAMMALFEDISTKDRIALLKDPKVPPVAAGAFALLASDPAISVKDRLAIAWKATPTLRGWISNSPHRIPVHDREALARSAPPLQQCWVARKSGAWLSSELRLEFAKGCPSSAIILDHIVKEQLLAPEETFQLGMYWLRPAYHEWSTPRDWGAARQLILMKKANLTPERRVQLLEHSPTWEPTGQRSVADSLYRRRRQFGFDDYQLTRIEALR